MLHTTPNNPVIILPIIPDSSCTIFRTAPTVPANKDQEKITPIRLRLNSRPFLTVIAYENLGPLDAFKRSSQLMKQKWGESLGATFSFGLIQFIAILVIGLALFFIGSLIHPIAGIALAVLEAFVIVTIMSAAQTIFVSAVYHDVTDDPVTHFNKALIDGLFINKK